MAAFIAFLRRQGQSPVQMKQTKQLSTCLGIGWWNSIPATTKSLAELLAFFGRHLFPPFPHAFSHSFCHAFSYTVTHVPFSAAGSPPSSKQNPAEKQQPKRLPEGNQAPTEKRRPQPISQ